MWCSVQKFRWAGELGQHLPKERVKQWNMQNQACREGKLDEVAGDMDFSLDLVDRFPVFEWAG